MSQTTDDPLKELSRSAAMQPKEQLLVLKEDNGAMFIGLPKEYSFQENRISLTPSAVGVLVSRGHRVIVEAGAGLSSGYSDNEYSEAGAEVTESRREVFKANMLLKVEPPSLDEIELMQHQQILISALQLSILPENFLRRLAKKNITAIAWDFLKDDEGIHPIVRAMGEIAGNTSILIAAELLASHPNGRKAMLGGITGVLPSEVVIIGAGTVAEYATRAALGVGANVTVFDESVFKLRRLQNDIGVRLNTCTIQPDKLHNALIKADVAIGAVRPGDGRTPCIVFEETVEQMNAGAVIVDVSIDRGGCFESSEVTTHQSPSIVKYGVIHYAVPNIASRVSRTASQALNNIFLPILLNFSEYGSLLDVLKTNSGVRSGVYMYNGHITNKSMADGQRMPFKDLNLLLALF